MSVVVAADREIDSLPGRRWAVDLKMPFPLTRIEIHQRTDGCQERMRAFTLFLSEKDEPIPTTLAAAKGYATQAIQSDGVKGIYEFHGPFHAPVRHALVLLRTADPLHIAQFRALLPVSIARPLWERSQGGTRRVGTEVPAGVHALMGDLARGLEDREFCDVVLHADGGDVHANAAVLALRSDHFRAMLSPKSGFRESRSHEVDLRDVPVATLQRVVRYLYTAQIFAPEEDTRGVESDELFALFEVADRFMLPSMQADVASELERLVTQENAIAFLNFAVNANQRSLAVVCAALIVSSFPQFQRRAEAVATLEGSKLFTKEEAKRPPIATEGREGPASGGHGMAAGGGGGGGGPGVLTRDASSTGESSLLGLSPKAWLLIASFLAPQTDG